MDVPKFIPEERPVMSDVETREYLTEAAARREQQSREITDLGRNLVNRVDQLENSKYTPSTTKVYTSRTISPDVASTIFLVDSSTGAVQITLPPAEQVRNRLYEFKVASAAPFAITIVPSSGLIDLAASLVLTIAMQDRTLISDGTNWWIV
jgi:hypothetical protein